jgi:uncharacterized protein (DUF2132 family)
LQQKTPIAQLELSLRRSVTVILTMTPTQTNNPLHGKTLENILTALVDHYGWEVLGQRITIRCFTDNPSIKSSLTFLRKTPWARQKVEELYLKLKTS